MRVLTKQILANEVANRWLKQYPLQQYKGTNKEEIYNNLLALGKTPNILDVNSIIGNKSWTLLLCDHCQNDSDVVIEFSDEAIYICKSCVDTAYKDINK